MHQCCTEPSPHKKKQTLGCPLWDKRSPRRFTSLLFVCLLRRGMSVPDHRCCPGLLHHRVDLLLFKTLTILSHHFIVLKRLLKAVKAQNLNLYTYIWHTHYPLQCKGGKEYSKQENKERERKRDCPSWLVSSVQNKRSHNYTTFRKQSGQNKHGTQKMLLCKRVLILDILSHNTTMCVWKPWARLYTSTDHPTLFTVVYFHLVQFLSWRWQWGHHNVCYNTVLWHQQETRDPWEAQHYRICEHEDFTYHHMFLIELISNQLELLADVGLDALRGRIHRLQVFP